MAFKPRVYNRPSPLAPNGRFVEDDAENGCDDVFLFTHGSGEAAGFTD